MADVETTMPTVDTYQGVVPSPEVQARAAAAVSTAYTRSENFLNPYFTKWRTYYELYRGFQANKHYQGRANLFVPLAFENIEDVNSRVFKAFNGIRTVPGDGKTTIEAARKSKKMLEHQTRLYNFKKAFEDQRQDASIYGYGITKTGWIYNSAKKKDHPIIGCVDVADYFFDPDGESREQLRYEIHRSWETLHNLRKNPNYFNLGLLDKAMPMSTANDPAPTQTAGGDASDSLKDSRYAAVGLNHPTQQGKLQVLEYWGLFAPVEGQLEEEYLITMAGDKVIRCEKNPYLDIFKDGVVDEVACRPFSVMKDTDIAHQYIGVGMVEPIQRLLEELNDTRNQRMDNVTLIVDQMYYVLDEADVNEDDLIARGGGVVYGVVPGGVTPLPRGDVTQSAYQEEVVIKEDIQRALGVSPLAKGAIEGLSGEAMHTVLAILESGNVRIDGKTSRFADAVARAYQIVLAFDQEFLEDEIDVLDEESPETAEGTLEYPKLSKKDIAGRIKIEVEMDTQMSRILRRAEAEKLFASLKGDPNINQKANTKLYLESLDRDPWIEELMNVPPPQPPGPEPPKISVSLSSDDLNALQIGELLSRAGVSQQASDPLLDPEMRALMQGKDPAKLDYDLKTAELREKLIEEERMTKQGEADAILKAKDLDIKERQVALAEGKQAQEARAATPKAQGGLASRIASVFKPRRK